eukprot:SAG31_NODE_860_length_11431_cov_8.068920_6_plen_162_part_00
MLQTEGHWSVYASKDVEEWCHRCVDPVSGAVDPLSATLLVWDNIEAMAILDIVALVLATIIVALAVVGELKDCMLCTLALRRNSHNESSIPKIWQRAMFGLGLLRKFVFLPTLVAVVPTLVWFGGGDALSICFNTIAILVCDSTNRLFPPRTVCLRDSWPS